MAQPALRTVVSASELGGAQRAAVLVMYLESPVAKLLLEHLVTREIQEIGLAMADVEYVDPAVIEEVVADFIRDLYRVAMVPKTGREFALDVLPDLIDDDRRERVYGALRRNISTEFADYIATRPERTIATIIQDEHPQSQAIALLLMGPDNAARVLEVMDEQERYDLSLRMARIEQVPGELADDVEAALRGALEDHGSDRWNVPGLDRTAQTLGRLGRPINEPLLGRIAKHDQELSERLRRKMVVFDDLRVLDNKSVQTLLKSIDRQSLLMALRGADTAMRDLFLSNMSGRAAEDLREELDIIGPQPKSKVDVAKEEIVQVAVRLHEEGVIRLAMGDSEDELV